MTHFLNKLRWHDGQLKGILLDVDASGAAMVELRGLFYTAENESQRTELQILCKGVSRYNCTLSASELKDNMLAGNISNGYLKDTTLWVYFSDGLLEIDATTFQIAER